MRRSQPVDELLDPPFSAVVQPGALARGQRRRNLDARHHDRPAEQVVEDHQRVRQHQHRVRDPRSKRVGGGVGEPLDRADKIVPQVPHGAAGEAGQAAHGDGRQSPQPLREVADGIVGLARRAPPRLARPALHGPVAVPQHFPRLGAEERVARPALAAHHRFQEKGERRPGELGEHGHGGVRVEHDLAHHRHHAARLRTSEKLGARVGHRAAAIRYVVGVSRALASAKAPEWLLLRAGTQ